MEDQHAVSSKHQSLFLLNEYWIPSLDCDQSDHGVECFIFLWRGLNRVVSDLFIHAAMNVKQTKMRSDGQWVIEVLI